MVHRVVFPEHPDPRVLPLYLDAQAWTSLPASADAAADLARRRGLPESSHTRSVRLTDLDARGMLRGRRGLDVPASSTVSLATYFNAFPASYWSRWTSLEAVTLRVRTSGTGSITVLRSNARAVVQVVESVDVAGDTTSEFELPLTAFLDGGWLWFDLRAGAPGLTMVDADWLAPESASPRTTGTASIAITTMDRGAMCVELLSGIGSDAAALEAIDDVWVVDQGSTPVENAPGFDVARDRLGGRLRVIQQDNLGGSGGFSRGMLEAVRSQRSEYVLLLDDDAEVEPEGIRRAIEFANFARTATIVGGHMFDMYDRAKLHALAEVVRPHDFMWGPITPGRHDLGDANLRQTPWLHRRYDVDYNGWWMCLIPVSVVREVGASLPAFIKWDDAEYSLRARAAGVPTVSLPGAAVWHVSWVDKDDSHDWQAFFHARNRLVTALLHSSERGGGRLWRANLADDLKHLLTMDYATVALRHEAIRSVFDGPEGLHDDLRTRLPRVRELGRGFREWQPIRDRAALARVPSGRVDASDPSKVDAGPSGIRLGVWLARQVSRHSLAPVPATRSAHPTVHLAFQDARWFVVPTHDSVLVSRADGSGATWHLREPRRFRRMLADSARLNLAYRRRWSRLRSQYRDAITDLTSLDAWAATLDGGTATATAPVEEAITSARRGLQGRDRLVGGAIVDLPPSS
ncbi:galactofuranosylgalactofuranosylrhamnosyl-N-acetylglucosaminyl-diphospho-decaprenol beta-1,5/1,6-galactofuranosyltransferase [Agromyces ramosus]|uniref:Galactofuranosylgalactofuranosylrhamnosyl-N-acetylglucosaminyl-diphospho-decaprenol beta-1,5/1,6-galactofuranosyltransferase n=1 Tax=Agromyces ramosus TaxID=33879 RepID=A0A4Q7MNW4_9MICO|nr:galactofuranosylgalactofuranosylrhamnosyl-N-acetylglucosaminyl-diphospho-decaprenol beta-1,5/1,6-galactofuranosyltransferase [Agromyces ramosus]